MIAKVVSTDKDITIPHDTVLDELRAMADKLNFADEELAMVMAVYMLGFSTYQGFEQSLNISGDLKNENLLKRMYAYAKKINSIIRFITDKLMKYILLYRKNCDVLYVVKGCYGL